MSIQTSIHEYVTLGPENAQYTRIACNRMQAGSFLLQSCRYIQDLLRAWQSTMCMTDILLGTYCSFKSLIGSFPGSSMEGTATPGRCHGCIYGIGWTLHLRHRVAHELEERLPQWCHSNFLLQQPHPSHDLIVPTLPKNARQQAQECRQPRRIALGDQRVCRPWPAAAHGIRAVSILAYT